MEKSVLCVFLACFSATFAFHLNQTSGSDISRSYYEIIETRDDQATAEAGPISIDIYYSSFWLLSANWSTTAKQKDYTHNYDLLNCTTYAASCEEFVTKYPTFTIETRGEAVSWSTFGDIGSGRFGSLTYRTSEFIVAAPVNNVYIIFNEQAGFGYWVGVKIGVALKENENSLILNPFINGYITSVGAYTRTLEFGLSVSTITFNPMNDVLSNEI